MISYGEICLAFENDNFDVYLFMEVYMNETYNPKQMKMQKVLDITDTEDYL